LFDFNKDVFAQFNGDNGKKMIFAIQQLPLNLKIADKTACLQPSKNSPDNPLLGGHSNHKVPTNMTSLSSYVIGPNPRAFQSSSRQPQDTAPGIQITPRCSSSPMVYGVISISCDKTQNSLSTRYLKNGQNTETVSR
jgi:hypothetical protein